MDGVTPPVETPTIKVTDAWERLFDPDHALALSKVLAACLPARRWFRSKSRSIVSVTLIDLINLPCADATAYLTVVQVTYAQGEPERYLLLLGLADRSQAGEILRASPQAVMAHLTMADGSAGVLYDAVGDPSISLALLDLIAEHRRLEGRAGEVCGHTTGAFEQIRGTGVLEPHVLRAEQTNTSIRFGDRLILKLYRRLDEGVTPDLEIGAYLTTDVTYPHTPAVAGHLESKTDEGRAVTLALLQAYVPNRGDAWSYSLTCLDQFFDRVPIDDASATSPIAALIGDYLEAVRLIAQRTAELHLALAAAARDPAMTAEPFDERHRESLCRDMRHRASQVFRQLRDALPQLPASVLPSAQRALRLEARALEDLGSILRVGNAGQRIRIHGDYHLGQLLRAGDDFVVIDFEGEPARPLSERRMKRSALADVAGMLRSFQYAAFSALIQRTTGESGASLSRLEHWARLWERFVGTTFLDRYLEAASKGRFLPDDRDARRILLKVHLLDKAVYELGYELNHRPTWLEVPLWGLDDLLKTGTAPVLRKT
ncbi:MAG: hypothetical protein GEV06_04375 [Luteitalea sp.]|nr:hypothetical protein [Luteitalea sp.]